MGLRCIDLRNVLVPYNPSAFDFEPILEVMPVQVSVVLVADGLNEVTDLLHQLIYIYSNPYIPLLIAVPADVLHADER